MMCLEREKTGQHDIETQCLLYYDEVQRGLQERPSSPVDLSAQGGYSWLSTSVTGLVGLIAALRATWPETGEAA